MHAFGAVSAVVPLAYSTGVKDAMSAGTADHAAARASVATSLPIANVRPVVLSPTQQNHVQSSDSDTHALLRLSEASSSPYHRQQPTAGGPSVVSQSFDRAAVTQGSLSHSSSVSVPYQPQPTHHLSPRLFSQMQVIQAQIESAAAAQGPTGHVASPHRLGGPPHLEQQPIRSSSMLGPAEMVAALGGHATLHLEQQPPHSSSMLGPAAMVTALGGQATLRCVQRDGCASAAGSDAQMSSAATTSRAVMTAEVPGAASSSLVVAQGDKAGAALVNAEPVRAIVGGVAHGGTPDAVVSAVATGARIEKYTKYGTVSLQSAVAMNDDGNNKYTKYGVAVAAGTSGGDGAGNQKKRKRKVNKMEASQNWGGRRWRSNQFSKSSQGFSGPGTPALTAEDALKLVRVMAHARGGACALWCILESTCACVHAAARNVCS